MNTFNDWFRSHDPFDGIGPQLLSLASGMAASESDETGTVGSEIQGSLDSVSCRKCNHDKEASDEAHPE